MRIVVFLLLAINVLVFAGHFLSDSPKEKENAEDSLLKIIAEKDLPENSTVNPQKVLSEEHKTPPPQESTLPEKEKAPEVAPPPPEIKEETPPPQPLKNENPPPKEEVANSFSTNDSNCLAWSDLNNEDALQLQKLLMQKFAHLPTAVSSKNDKNGKWRIFIPPFPDSDSARARARSLKELSLDYFVLASGENKNAISLGVFTQEKTARQYMDELQQKGVNDAVLQFKGSGGDIDHTQIKVDFTTPNERAQLLEAVQKILPEKEAEQCR